MRTLILFFSLCLTVAYAQTAPRLLKKTDVRPAMEEMFQYHVEYKEWNSQLARRTIKLYFEQFDPEKIYLLAGEVDPYLSLSDRELSLLVKEYNKGNLSFFEKMNQTIEQAILRAQRLRVEVASEFDKQETLAAQKSQLYSTFAPNEQVLKERLSSHLLRMALFEEKSFPHPFSKEEIQKVSVLWERRLQRMESSYLPSSSEGSSAEHAFALHLLKAFPKSLDAHTAYFSPQEAWEMRSSLEKQFEGIGVVLREGIDGVRIVSLVASGPAERSKVMAPGDLLVAIDGQEVQGESYEKVLNLLQGSGSKSVHLICARGKEQYTVTLQREKIVMEDERLKYSFEPFADGVIGKIVLPSFYENMDGLSCERDIRDALRALKKEGPLYGLVLDLRENAGGFLSQAVKVAGLFISSGVVVISKYAQGKIQYLRSIDGRSYYNGPLVILTSRGSASAAEIVAQALQDYGVGLVVGDDRTYGKGTIQYQTVTDASAKAFFKVTVGRYYTVSGRSTQIDGVQADIIVPTILSAYPIGERYLEYPLNSDRVPSAYIDVLTDVDSKNLNWFQKNYLPALQKKLSIWTQMKEKLIANSAERLKKDPDYSAFLENLPKSKEDRARFRLTNYNSFKDLQMTEGVNLIKDMLLMSTFNESAG